MKCIMKSTWHINMVWLACIGKHNSCLLHSHRKRNFTHIGWATSFYRSAETYTRLPKVFGFFFFFFLLSRAVLDCQPQTLETFFRVGFGSLLAFGQTRLDFSLVAICTLTSADGRMHIMLFGRNTYYM